ncbi:hypothetical protein ZOSMA_735G00010 [Zostera marina]|uniref:RNA helicase n=1 Tax=Zostera marina TaxID=29655 RepID=A0A0K9NS57_ZOSMR|nr:hypothetical protein ZOSMA_735G00010 [Zostera marina]
MSVEEECCDCFNVVKKKHYNGWSEIFKEFKKCKSRRRFKNRRSNNQFELSMYNIMHGFSSSNWVREKAVSSYIPKYMFFNLFSSFRDFVKSRLKFDPLDHLVKLGCSSSSYCFLFHIFVEFCSYQFPNMIETNKDMVEYCVELTKQPKTWYPTTRSVKRSIIYHCGPTNSGKTHAALKRFMDHNHKAIYCSPLRILAIEVCDRVNASGISCNLITGQEKIIKPLSTHISCTIETITTDDYYDVAIIDEIQMACDEQRGGSWTRALLGIKANEIHLCGDTTAMKMITKIRQELEEDLTIKRY